MSLSLSLNGQQREFAGLNPGDPLQKLIGELHLKSDRVAVERNGEIVSRNNWNEELLSADDRIEVVHFVGGGLNT
jgi:sulfur carrier protein